MGEAGPLKKSHKDIFDPLAVADITLDKVQDAISRVHDYRAHNTPVSIIVVRRKPYKTLVPHPQIIKPSPRFPLPQMRGRIGLHGKSRPLKFLPHLWRS
jgi:hypothetical protein